MTQNTALVWAGWLLTNNLYTNDFRGTQILRTESNWQKILPIKFEGIVGLIVKAGFHMIADRRSQLRLFHIFLCKSPSRLYKEMYGNLKARLPLKAGFHMIADRRSQ